MVLFAILRAPHDAAYCNSRAHGAGALIEKEAPPYSGGGLGTTLGI